MRKKYKKIKYSTGLVSIIFLPILCMLYFKITNSFDKYNSIEINRPIICFADQIHRDFPFNLFPNKKYINYTITGDDKKDSTTLDSAKFKMKLFLQNKDTLTGIHYNFNSNSKYWTYIQALDLSISDTSFTYLTKNNNIWLFYDNYHFNTQLPVLTMLDDMYLRNSDLLFKDNLLLLVNQFLEDSKNILRLAYVFWPSTLLFIVMIISSFRNISSLKKGSL